MILALAAPGGPAMAASEPESPLPACGIAVEAAMAGSPVELFGQTGASDTSVAVKRKNPTGGTARWVMHIIGAPADQLLSGALYDGGAD